MLLRDNELVNVLLAFDLLLFQLFRDLLVDSAHPGFCLFVQDAEFGIKIQVFDIGRINDYIVRKQVN